MSFLLNHASRRRHIGDDTIDPSSVSAVSSWFRLSHEETAITGSGYSSVYDVLNPSSPAVQATDADRPPAGTDDNGRATLVNSAGVLNTPLISARNGSVTWGFWCWLRTTSLAAIQGITWANGGSGVGLRKPSILISTTGQVQVNVYTTASGGFRYTTAMSAGNILVANAETFLTVQYNGNLTGDANRCVVTLGETVTTGSFGAFGASGATEMPATIAAPAASTANAMLDTALAGSAPFQGEWGNNFGYFGSAVDGAEQGLLTPAALLALMNFEPLEIT